MLLKYCNLLPCTVVLRRIKNTEFYDMSVFSVLLLNHKRYLLLNEDKKTLNYRAVLIRKIIQLHLGIVKHISQIKIYPKNIFFLHY